MMRPLTNGSCSLTAAASTSTSRLEDVFPRCFLVLRTAVEWCCWSSHSLCKSSCARQGFIAILCDLPESSAFEPGSLCHVTAEVGTCSKKCAAACLTTKSSAPLPKLFRGIAARVSWGSSGACRQSGRYSNPKGIFDATVVMTISWV